MKKKITISLDDETYERLTKMVEERHTSISQFITDRIWEMNFLRAENMEKLPSFK